jgi:hypothetical protein
MTYEEAKKELLKTLPKGRHYVQVYIRGLKDQKIVDKLCAKWFASEAKSIMFIAQPVPPNEWFEMKSAKEFRTDAWKKLWVTLEVQEYVHTKQIVDCSNYSHYMNMKEMVQLLDDSETKTKEFLKEKIKHFLAERRKQSEQPFPAYEYDSKRAMYSNN